ncbi:MAG: hypothetical protein L6R28_14295 [Planctomycetes bacterium]|nr:hypothetical protein [Planctomycetota bacterium]
MADRVLLVRTKRDGATLPRWDALRARGRNGKLNAGAAEEGKIPSAFLVRLSTSKSVFRSAGVEPADSAKRGATVAEAAHRTAMLEPWDVLAIDVDLSDAAERAAFEAKVVPFVEHLIPGVAVLAVESGAHSGYTAWSGGLPAGPGALPDANAEDLWPTILNLLGLNAPELAGSPLELQAAAVSSDYAADEEAKIQERLEDLGYL